MINNEYIRKGIILYVYTVCFYLLSLGFIEAIGLYNVEVFMDEKCKNNVLRGTYIANIVMNILSALSLANTFNKYRESGDFSEVTNKRSITLVIAICVKSLMAMEYFTHVSCNIENKKSTDFINFILLTETITLFLIIITIIMPSTYIIFYNYISSMETIMSQDELHESLLRGEYQYDSQCEINNIL